MSTLKHTEEVADYQASPADGIRPYEKRREKVLKRRQFVSESIVVCVLCAIYYVLYVPCIYSIWKHMRDNSCYKLLFYIGMTDLAILWAPGFFCGWANLRGAVFCSYPTLMYFVGLAVSAFWSAETTADLYEPWLFKEHDIVVAFLSPLIYLIFAAKLFYDVRKSRRQFGAVLSEMDAVQIRRHRIGHIGGVTVVRPKITLVNGALRKCEFCKDFIY
ncbi:hypothetical protein GPALN_006051 [Globodera pallida]|nr:hypothetical protein GPALN_006051 [Globodera pallida]